MRFTIKIAACAALLAAPASAQILGGSGGGGLGGSLGGTVGGVTGNVGGTLSGGLGGTVGGVTGADGVLGVNADADARAGRFDTRAAVALNASTAAAVEPGTVVRDARGRAIGTVQAVRTTAQGMAQAVLVRVGDRVAALPPENFGVTAEALVSAMGRAELRREARRQEQSASRDDARGSAGQRDRSRSVEE